MNRRKFVAMLVAAPVAAGMASAIAGGAAPAANTIHIGHKMPSTRGIGDIWVETDNHNKIYVWNGTEWVTPAFG